MRCLIMNDKFKYFCSECEISFDIKSEEENEAFFCPFCGREIINEDDELLDDMLDDVLFEDIDL